MSFLLNSREMKARPSGRFAVPETDFGTGFDQGLNSRLFADSSDSGNKSLIQVKRDFTDALNADLQEGEAPFPYPVARLDESEILDGMFARVRRAREVDKTALPGLPSNMAELRKKQQELVAKSIADARALDDNWSMTGFLGQAAGEVVGALSDPVDLIALGVAPFVPAGGVARTILTEAAIGAAAEGTSGLGVAHHRHQMGMEYGFTDWAIRTGMGGAAGGGFAGLVLAAKPAAKKVADWAGLGRADNALVKGPAPEVDDLSAEERGAVHALDREFQMQDDLGDTGVTASASTLDDHIDAVNAQAHAAAQMEPVAGDYRPFAPDPGVSPHSAIQRLDPAGLRADLFPGRTGDGALTGDVWDASRSGVVYVFEDGNGQRFIVDGHQRLALAQRARAAGQNADIHAFVFRAADGWTPDQLQVLAAVKNSGQVPQSDLARHVSNLTALDDGGFRLVAAGSVPESHAALVGRLVSDRDMQNAILRALAHIRPADASQAEIIVRQAIDAGSVDQLQRMTGLDLGADPFPARDAVLARALADLPGDRDLFAGLVEQAGNLPTMGPVTRISANADMALHRLGQQANIKGDLSDALSAAARTFTDTGEIRRAAGEFTDAVRGHIVRGDFADPPAGRRGSDAPSAAAGGGSGQSGASPGGTKSPGEAELTKFDGPEAEGPAGQIEAIEADLRQMQDAGDVPDALRDMPVGERIDAETGARIADTRDVFDILDDLKGEQKFLDDVIACRKGAA